MRLLKKALLNDPTNADAFNNIGTILKKEGKLKEAIDAFNQAILNEPKNADAYNNLGTALKEKGLLDKAVTAFRKALTIKPKYAVAHNNLGNTLKEQGKLQKAIEAYDNAIAIKPDYAAAFRNHSMLITYKPGDHKITQVSKLLKHQNLTDSDRCHLHFAYAKMKEDLEELNEAFDNYLTGGQLRQKILAYDFLQDGHFAELKNSEMMRERLNLAREVRDYIGKYYSVNYVRKHILKQSESEIKQMDAEIKKEIDDGIISAPTADVTDTTL